MLLPQHPLVGFHYSFRQLQRVLPSTRLAVPDGEIVHRAEGVTMLLPQRSIPRFHHLFRQLQRVLSSTHPAVCECKINRHPLTVFAYIAEMKHSIVPTAETSIDMRHEGFSEPVVSGLKGPRYRKSHR